jgi:multicomponent K+:H+ antiporter subunit G
MTILLDAIIAGLIVLGGAFALIGSWGLARLPTLMCRLHGPTMATTLGVGGCLLGAMLHGPGHGLSWSGHELLIALFLFITAPISANMIAKAYLHGRGVSGETPGPRDDPIPEPPYPGADWATFGFPRNGQPDEDGPA